MDWCIGTYQQCRTETYRCHSSRILFIRQENLPQPAAVHIPIELRRRIPNLPIICDPSHIGGKRELIAPLCQQAMDLGFDGLIIESHCNPECAWSDAAQQVTPDILDYILNLLVIRSEHQTTET